MGRRRIPNDLKGTLLTWTSRRMLLTHVEWLAKQVHVRELCRRNHVSVETWRTVTVNDLHDCDDSTGRGMGTTQAVAAARVHRTTQTVYNVRRINRQLGICVEYFRGRELSQDERDRLPQGHRQHGLANLYAYGICPAHYRAKVSVPRAGRYAEVARLALPLCSKAFVSSDIFSPHPSRPASGTQAPRRKRRAGLALAYELSAHPGMGFLDGVPQVKYAALLKGHHICGWHGLALGDALLVAAETRHINLGRKVPNPFGLLATLLPDVKMDREMPERPVVLAPCELCDHGWIDTPEGAVKCPVCPPSSRGILSTDVGGMVEDWEGDECPF